MDDACAVCAEPLEWVTYGACGHREVCSACVARLRFVLRDHRCCLCMTHCPAVFATKAIGDRTRVIGDFSALPAAAGEGKAGEYWHHEGTQAWFDDADHYRKVSAMCWISCTVCEGKSKATNRGKKGSKVSKTKHKNNFGSIEQLKAHLLNQHYLYMCDLCLDGKKVFIREQKLYTRPQLNQHIKTGDSEVDGSKVERCGFIGHPICEFCKSPFYGENELYTHMTREHYSCHICQRQHFGDYDYFRNYDDLEMHFRSDHFFCEDRGCLEKKFIVFESEAELKRHNAVEHMERMSRSQKNTALQNSIVNSGHSLRNQVASVAAPLRPLSICSRSGQSSQAGESSGPNRVLHPSYFSPLSRQEVPGARTNSALQEAASPPISEQSRYTAALSWSSVTAARIMDEAFPPLSSTIKRTSELTRGGVRMVDENTHSSPSPSWHTPSPGVDICGSLSLTPAGNGRQETLVNSQMCTVEDVHAANKCLVERMRTALGMDQDRYAMFKEISGEYRQGVINASNYLSYVEQFGLSHLVLEMSRLLPDPQKQKELADAYYANLRLTSLQGNGGGGTVGSKEGSQKKKGKGKVKIPDSTETTNAVSGSPEVKFLSTPSRRRF